MTALNFPANPSDGDTFGNYVYNAGRGVWSVQANAIGVSSRHQISPTTPTTPENGDIWFNSTDDVTYMYYVDGETSSWIEIGGVEANISELNELNDVTITSPASGQVLQYNGSGWVDGINIDPTSPVVGQALVYNGTKWVNGESAGGFEQQFLLMGA